MAVVRRGNVWQAQVRIRQDDGGRWITKSATADTKAAAEKAERALMAERDSQRQRFVEPTNATLNTFLDGWWERTKPRLRPKTVALYEDVLEDYIRPRLGAIRLSDLSPRRVQGWLDGMGARNITERARMVLRVALDEAERLGWVSVNVADRTRAPYREKPKRESFDLTELQAILKAAEDHRIAPLVRFAAYTGLRRGELLGLRWDDVDWTAQTVTVRRQVVDPKGAAVVQENPKTRAGQRVVPLFLPALAALRAQKAMLAKERLVSPWVFPNQRGELPRPNYIDAAFQKALKRAKMEPKPFHALRHTAASILLSAGVEPAQAAKIMGHKSLAVFYSIYADMLPQAGQEVARQVDAFLAAAESKTTRAKGGRR